MCDSAALWCGTRAQRLQFNQHITGAVLTHKESAAEKEQHAVFTMFQHNLFIRHHTRAVTLLFMLAAHTVDTTAPPLISGSVILLLPLYNTGLYN